MARRSAPSQQRSLVAGCCWPCPSLCATPRCTMWPRSPRPPQAPKRAPTVGCGSASMPLFSGGAIGPPAHLLDPPRHPLRGAPPNSLRRPRRPSPTRLAFLRAVQLRRRRPSKQVLSHYLRGSAPVVSPRWPSCPCPPASDLRRLHQRRWRPAPTAASRSRQCHCFLQEEAAPQAAVGSFISPQAVPSSMSPSTWASLCRPRWSRVLA